MDSMNLWIDMTPDELRDVLKRVDILKIDDAEAAPAIGRVQPAQGGGEDPSRWGQRCWSATRGSHGVMLFNGSDIFAAPAYPLEDEVDPTGAGDSFAGGFFGYLAQHPTLDKATLRRAIIFGSVMGSFCVEDFGTRRLERLTYDEIMDRYRRIKQLTHFEEL